MMSELLSEYSISGIESRLSRLEDENHQLRLDLMDFNYMESRLKRRMDRKYQKLSDRLWQGGLLVFMGLSILFFIYSVARNLS